MLNLLVKNKKVLTEAIALIAPIVIEASIVAYRNYSKSKITVKKGKK